MRVACYCAYAVSVAALASGLLLEPDSGWLLVLLAVGAVALLGGLLLSLLYGGAAPESDQ